jgi:hypothetical protein
MDAPFVYDIDFSFQHMIAAVKCRLSFDGESWLNSAPEMSTFFVYHVDFSESGVVFAMEWLFVLDTIRCPTPAYRTEPLFTRVGPFDSTRRLARLTAVLMTLQTRFARVHFVANFARQEKRL